MPAPLASLGTIIDQSFHRYREHFRELLSISVWMLAGYPLYFIALFIIHAAPQSAAAVLIATLISLLGSFVFLLAVIVTLGAMILGVDAADKDKKVNARAVLKASIQKLPRQFVLWVAMTAIVVASILFLVPGYLVTMTASLPDVVQGIGILMFFLGALAAIGYSVYFGVTLVFAPYAMMLEGRKVAGSLARTHTLTSNRWWATALRVILPKLLIIVAALFLQLVVMTFVNIVEAALLSPEAIANSTLSFSIAVMVKQMIATMLAAIIAPMYVIADYYVYQSLVATGTKDAS